MKTFISIILLSVVLITLAEYFEQNKEPYEEGMHLDYSIICENGFVYKQLNRGYNTSVKFRRYTS